MHFGAVHTGTKKIIAVIFNDMDRFKEEGSTFDGTTIALIRCCRQAGRGIKESLVYART